MLEDLIQQSRQDIKELDDSPRAQALLETTAEVVQGLQTAYRHYDEKSEVAWQDGG